MNKQLVLKVLKDFNAPIARKVGENTYFSQTMFAEVGKPFPVEVKVSLPSISEALPIGEYYVKPSAYQTGKYGDLEFNRYELYSHLELIQPSALQKV